MRIAQGCGSTAHMYSVASFAPLRVRFALIVAALGLVAFAAGVPADVAAVKPAASTAGKRLALDSVVALALEHRAEQQL